MNKNIVFLIGILMLIVAPFVVADSCQGDYVSLCTADSRVSCDSWQVGDTSLGLGQGCSSDAMTGCEDVRECTAADDFGNCDRDQYICLGTPTCAISDCTWDRKQNCDATFTSCIGLTKDTCESKTIKDQAGQYESGCQWVVDGDCAASQTKEVSCEGTYQVTEPYQSCTGEYRECQTSGNSGLSPMLNFFSLITGYVSQQSTCTDIEMETQQPMACTNQQCDSNYLGICDWQDSTRTVVKQCSTLNESTCVNTAGCTKTTSCIDCTDSDGGINYFAKGTSTYGGGSATDFCAPANPDILWEYSCVGVGQTYTCPNGCFDGECVEKMPNCGDCNTNDQCVSGLCSDVLGTTGKKCVDSGNCASNSATQCEIPSGSAMCQGIYIANCNGGHWSESECLGTCEGTVCTLDPVLSWRDASKSQLLSSKVFSFSDNIVSVVVSNPTITSGSIEIKESDSGEGSLNTDELIKSIPIVMDAGKATISWEITEADFLLTPDDADDIFEFYFVYDGIKSSILTVTKDPLVDSCSNGFQDGNETDVDCGGFCPSTCPAPTCSDAKQNQDETDVDCGGVCGCPSPSCDSKSGCTVSKSLFWLDENNNVINNRIVLNSENLSGSSFKMILENPSASPGDFVLKEYDGLLINDNLGTFSGVDSSGTYEYVWTTSYSNFWEAESSDEDGIYEFYFEVDGETSPQMEIEVVGVMPTCNDGIKNGAETGINLETGEGCGGECPACPVNPCLGNTVCTDYKTSGECSIDNCEVAIDSVPALGENEKASCYWDESNSPSCNSQILSIDKLGKDIGGCNYLEDAGSDTCDDDGFLSYSYTADWIWAPNNNYTSDKSSDTDYVLGEDGRYHYDPERKSLKCQSGSRTVQCPAQIQLSFFDWRNLLVAVILTIIIYFIIEYIKNKNLPKIKKEKHISTSKKKKKK